MASDAQHCSFVMLSEFDIDRGAQLTYQFPQPLGMDELLLANLMLPDGAEKHLEDWTIFFLNQTPFNTIAPALAPETPERKEDHDGDDDEHGELLYVLNLVRTKHDKSVRRGAVVKAMAICTRHHFIQIFKPVLLMALDDYFNDPSQDCLARLFDAVNAMDLSAAPNLTRHEKIVMRSSERKDIFAEKTAMALNRSREANSASSSTLVTSRGGNSIDLSSSSSSHHGNQGANVPTATVYNTGMAKDTHYFHTLIDYGGHQLPIKMPLYTFPEEVGDYSLIQLVQTFSAPTVSVSGPQHPHLHTNGNLTHPIIILFNALVTGKRIIFLGHNRPAGQVAHSVLSACALGSGCGIVLRGFIARAFPYANLMNRDEWESVPAYIAGVTNPIFESGGSWDLLFDVGTGRVMISKDIHTNVPLSHNTPVLSTLRTGGSGREFSTGTEEEFGRLPPQKTDLVAKADCTDNVFLEEIVAAISSHFGEGLVRMRLTDYVTRFVRIASRWEEDVLGSTKIGYRTASFIPEGPSCPVQLGSGIFFGDEATAARELATNASRIEAWRRTTSYQYCVLDFQRAQATNSVKGFDVLHQLFRLRYAKNISDDEVEFIMRTIAENVQTYDQVIELLAYMTPHSGGLLQLSFGLLHQQKCVREKTVDILNELRLHPVGVLFLQSLNHFQRYAYVRQAHARERNQAQEQQQSKLAPSAHMTRR